jgi:hypothetical protein
VVLDGLEVLDGFKALDRFEMLGWLKGFWSCWRRDLVRGHGRGGSRDDD